MISVTLAENAWLCHTGVVYWSKRLYWVFASWESLENCCFGGWGKLLAEWCLSGSSWECRGAAGFLVLLLEAHWKPLALQEPGT